MRRKPKCVGRSPLLLVSYLPLCVPLRLCVSASSCLPAILRPLFLYPLHDVADDRLKVGVGRLELGATDDQRCAKDHDLGAHLQRLDRLVDAQTAHRLYGNVHCGQDARQVVERAEAGIMLRSSKPVWTMI